MDPRHSSQTPADSPLSEADLAKPQHSDSQAYTSAIARSRVAYFTSRFPKLTETFILFEILGLERQDIDVLLYPLIRQRADLIHTAAEPVVARARYLPFVSGGIVASQFWWLAHHPIRYVRTIVAALTGTFGSLRFFIGAIGILPKVAHAARQMAAEGVRHVHCSWATHAALAGFIVRRLVGIPYSFTAHGSDLHVDRTMLCEKVSEASFVVAITEYNKRLILDECPSVSPDKIDVIHAGIDADFFVPAPRPGASSRYRILAVGSLLKVKGHTYLIEACRLLAEDGIDFECRIVGGGELREDLSVQIAQADLQDRITLTGPLTREQVVSQHREADVFVTPSIQTERGDREGLPVVLMEACGSGLPVVASRISGIPELVDDGVTGFLVPPRDPKAIADALRRLHDDPKLRQALGKAGRQKVLDEFEAFSNAERLASRILAVSRPQAD